MAEKVYTTEEVAEHLRLKPLTVRQYLAAGKMNGVKIGKDWRVRERDLQAYIDGLTSPREKQS